VQARLASWVRANGQRLTLAGAKRSRVACTHGLGGPLYMKRLVDNFCPILETFASLLIEISKITRVICMKPQNLLAFYKNPRMRANVLVFQRSGNLEALLNRFFCLLALSHQNVRLQDSNLAAYILLAISKKYGTSSLTVLVIFATLRAVDMREV
jgi:hypothetical protein